MRGVVSEEIRKDERSRGGRLRELPPGPSKSRGGWLCPILLGTLESVVAGVCVARGEGLGFHRHLWWYQLQACWLSGDKVAPVVWWLSSEEESKVWAVGGRGHPSWGGTGLKWICSECWLHPPRDLKVTGINQMRRCWRLGVGVGWGHLRLRINPVRVLEAEGDSSNPGMGNWMKNRHRWRWREVDNAGEASAQVRHGFLASVIPALGCTWWWGTKEEETSHWPGSERDRQKQKIAQVDIEPSAYWTAAPTKAVAAGTPATSGPWKTQTWCRLTAWIRGFYMPRNKGRNQIRQNLSGHVVYYAEIYITNIWPPKWQVFWTTGKGSCCCRWACATGRHFHCLIVAETMWSRFTYKITEPWRIEVTFQRSEVTVRIRPIDISRTHDVSPFVIFKHPDKEQKKKAQH